MSNRENAVYARDSPIRMPAGRTAAAPMSIQEQTVRAYEESREDVYHYLLRFGLDTEHAQECTQEVFLRLFMALRDGESIRNPRAWVFRVAHNLGQNTSVQKKYWNNLDPLKEAALPDRDPGPEERAIARQRNGRILDALASLSPQQRQCLELRAEGLRYREIAATIGVGVSTVGEFLSRAVTRLRKSLDEHPQG